jgi:hypothetical protein
MANNLFGENWMARELITAEPLDSAIDSKLLMYRVVL